METRQEIEQKFQDLIREALEYHFKKRLALNRQAARNNKKSQL